MTVSAPNKGLTILATQEDVIGIFKQLKDARLTASNILATLERTCRAEGKSESDFIAILGSLGAMSTMKTYGWTREAEDEFDARLIRKLLHHSEPTK